MITQEKSKQIQRLLNTYRWEATDLYELEAIVKEHIDPNYKVCGYCQAQLRHILVRLREWYMVQQVEGNEPLEEPIVESKIEVDVVEADKGNCTKCKRKTKNKK